MPGAAVPDALEMQASRIVPTEYGFRLRSTDELTVEVHKMLVNWRLVLHVHGIECSPPTPEDPEGNCPTLAKGYCYFGTGLDSLTRAVAAGLAWDDPVRTDPTDFDKRAF